ncbi:MAG: hypothetical protein ACRD1P_01220 [Thermoanaerobaculia bacterium]
MRRRLSEIDAQVEKWLAAAYERDVSEALSGPSERWLGVPLRGHGFLASCF